MRYPCIVLVFMMLLCASNVLFGQCSGTLGDPIIKKDFGSGTTTFGPALTSGETNYGFIAGSPDDGQYAIVKTTSGLNSGWIQDIVNHTPNDPNGYMMLVNADDVPGIFYQSAVNGLCPNTTYEFSAWIINVLRNPGIKPKVKFSIENNGVNIVPPLVTPDIVEGNSTNWVRYSLTFTTPANLGNITLKMTNENPGGRGNDLALDDITFSACGPSLTPSIGGSNATFTSICEGTDAAFEFKTEVSPGVYQDARYQWQINTGSGFSDIPKETSTTLNVRFQNAARGVYQYRLLAADGANIGAANCRIAGSALTVQVTPRPIAAIETLAPICAGNAIQLKASGGTTYKWTGPNGFTSTAQNPIIPNATTAMTGNYTVNVSANSCDAAATINVRVLPPVLPALNIQSATICEGNAIQLVASGGTAYLWQPALGLSDPQAPNPIASPTQTTTYRVRISNSACAETLEVNIKVNKNAFADAGEDRKIISGQSVSLNGKVSGEDFTYYWTPADYLDDPTKLNPVASPPTDITYTLHTISNLGCINGIDEVFVKVYPKIVIPNTFSPNGDAVNDTWNIPAASAFASPVLKISNRNGQLVYESKGPFKPWDGKFKGKDLPPAPYYYTIYFNEDFKMFSGWVMLMR